MIFKRKACLLFILLALVSSMWGCANNGSLKSIPVQAAQQENKFSNTSKADANRISDYQEGSASPSVDRQKEKSLFSDMPSYRSSLPARRSLSETPLFKTDFLVDDSSLNIRNMPVGAFINEIFGDILGLNFQISPQVLSREDLVTLRAQEVSKTQLFDLAKSVLSDYGIGIRKEQGDFLRFLIRSDPDMLEPPLLVTGEALPSVPESHRTIFQFVQLNAVAESQVRSWLSSVFSETGLLFLGDDMNNAIVIKGPGRAVKQAVEAIRLLDKPNMRGKHTVRITPSFLDAGTMAKSLSQVLQSEGIQASLIPPIGAVILLPLKSSNSVIVFSADLALIEHIKDWARELDVPPINSGGNDFFYYSVKNTSAVDLAESLGVETSGIAIGNLDGSQGISGARNIFVDQNRNGLVFTGRRDEWIRFLPLIEAMDKPARLVNVEVTVASVALQDQTDLGISWLFKNSMDRFDGVGSTDFASGGSGFTYNLNNAGQVRFALNMLAQDQRVAILSKPSILVKSGETASIDVGEEIPVITSQGQSTENVTSPVLQTIDYRKTGVILEVTPTVHSGNRVDLAVQQEVSEVLTGQASGLSTPSIFNRSLDTSLTLRDGGAVILGGLISGSSSDAKSKIPLVGDIPVFGSLFRKSGKQESRSELIVLIQAFIMDLDDELHEFNKEMKAKFELIEYDKIGIEKQKPNNSP